MDLMTPGDQHDQIMQEILESNADEKMTQIRELGSLQVADSDEATAEESDKIIPKLIVRLGNVGINSARTRLPHVSDHDYEANDRDTFEFLCVIVGSAPTDQLRYEILRKFRMGSRIVHPDKTSHFQPRVKIWTDRMMQHLSHLRALEYAKCKAKQFRHAALS